MVRFRAPLLASLLLLAAALIAVLPARAAHNRLGTLSLAR